MAFEYPDKNPDSRPQGGKERDWSNSPLFKSSRNAEPLAEMDFAELERRVLAMSEDDLRQLGTRTGRFVPKVADGKEADGQDVPSELELLDMYAKHFQDGVVTIATVMANLPDTPMKAHARMFIDTGTLWMEQAFNMHLGAARARADREARGL